MELTAVLTPAEEGGFIALNPETGTTTQGETVEEAITNLREATALYLSEFPLQTKGHPLVELKVGTLAGLLRQAAEEIRRQAPCRALVGLVVGKPYSVANFGTIALLGTRAWLNSDSASRVLANSLLLRRSIPFSAGHRIAVTSSYVGFLYSARSRGLSSFT